MCDRPAPGLNAAFVDGSHRQGCKTFTCTKDFGRGLLNARTGYKVMAALAANVQMQRLGSTRSTANTQNRA
jgi:hypothetical protein